MKFDQSSNPTLSKKIFGKVFSGEQTEPMTVNGALNKSILLALLIFLTGSITWKMVKVDPAGGVNGFMIFGAIGGLILALVTVFKQNWAPYTSPAYALMEGLFLGGISAFFDTLYPGIAIKAIGLTFAVLFILLFTYRSGLIKPTQKFKMGILAATGAIGLFYLVLMIINLFGGNASVFSFGWVGVGIQVFIVAIAALNLILDFDFIEQGAAQGAPKFVEWYAAFGLMVTLVWLYLEILRLLALLASSRD